MKNANAMRNRVAKYLIPVFIFSVCFNIPKFFESAIEYRDQYYKTIFAVTNRKFLRLHLKRFVSGEKSSRASKR